MTMLIVANWKAYVEDLAKAKKLVSVSKRLTKQDSSIQIVLAPPAPFLSELSAKNVSAVSFAAQDISATSGGAETGEVTAAAVRSAGATYLLVGHSERRAKGDSDAVVTEKIVRGIAQGLIPILCVGERERDSEGRYLATIREEITSALSALLPRERAQVIIAYEPLWAIGKTAAEAISGEDLAEMVLYIRKVLSELLPGTKSSRALVLYGGSVESGNVHALGGKSGINGFLIGRASVDPTLFTSLVMDVS